jgi:hypothetical protein
MSAKQRLILILAAAAVIFYPLLTWFLISSKSWRGSTEYMIFFVLFILAVAPIYPLVVKGLRKRPLLFALGILLVITSEICGFASLTGILVLHLDAGWAYEAADLSMGLAIASCVLFIWNVFVQRNKQ